MVIIFAPTSTIVLWTTTSSNFCPQQPQVFSNSNGLVQQKHQALVANYSNSQTLKIGTLTRASQNINRLLFLKEQTIISLVMVKFYQLLFRFILFSLNSHKNLLPSDPLLSWKISIQNNLLHVCHVEYDP